MGQLLHKDPPKQPNTMASPALRAKARRIHRLLIEEYGRPEWLPSLDPLSELVATILSQHTSDVNSHRAFANLRARFRSWREVADAPVGTIAEAVRTAGMASIKAPRIKESLAYVAKHAPPGPDGERLSLNFLSKLDLPEAKAWLRSIPGVGPKTAACVLMFGLNMPAMPVDTHVHRVARRLGLIEGKTAPDAAHDLLESLMPPENVYSFHVNLIRHGRKVCKAPAPLCPRCNLTEECDYYSTIAASGGVRGPADEEGPS